MDPDEYLQILDCYYHRNLMDIIEQLKEHGHISRGLYFNDFQAFDKYVTDNYSELKK